jgi:hypothetical protein
MNLRSLRWPLAVLLGLALLAPAAASAEPPPGKLPVGQAKGVRLVLDHGSIVLVFSNRASRLRQRINSPHAWIDCTEFPDADEEFGSGFGGNLDGPARGRRFNTGIEGSGADFCRVYLRAHTVKRPHSHIHVPRTVLFSIPITQAGAVYLDEEAGTRRMLRASIFIAVTRDKLKLSTYPTYAQILQAYPRAKRSLVALAAPADAPPPKLVGYYSDGQEHTALATLSTLGKRLFIENSSGDVFSSNVTAHVFDDWLF